MILLACPSWGAGLKAENHGIGKLFVCPRCRTPGAVPRSLGQLVCRPIVERQPPMPVLLTEPEEMPAVPSECLETGRELAVHQDEQHYEEEWSEPSRGNHLLPLIGALCATGFVALLGILMLSPGKTEATLVIRLSQPGITIFVDGNPRPAHNETSVIINDPGPTDKLAAIKSRQIRNVSLTSIPKPSTNNAAPPESSKSTH